MEADNDRAVPLLRHVASSAAPNRSNRAVLVAVSLAALLPLHFGFALGFTSPALAAVAAAFSPPLSTAQKSAFSSLVNIGAMATSLAAGRLTDTLGRRRVMAAMAVVGTFGWLAIALAPEVGVWCLCAGRVLSGCALGGSSVSVNVYIAEIAPPELRGALGATFQVAVTVGILAVYALGAMLPWRALALAGAAPCAALLLGLCAVPETPRWLLLVRRDPDAARRTLVRIRGSSAGVDEELEAMAEEQAATAGEDGGGSAADERGARGPYLGPSVPRGNAVDQGLRPRDGGEGGAFGQIDAPPAAAGGPCTCSAATEASAAAAAHAAEAGTRRTPAARQQSHAWVWRPIAITTMLMVAQQLSGINAVIFYAKQILEDANFVSFAASASVAVAVAQAAVTIASVPLMDAVGRRPLLLAAASGMAISQAVISVFFLSGRHTPALALAGLCGSVATFSLGFGAIPWSIMGELFPQRVRGLASSVATLSNWTFSFVVTLTFHFLVEGLGEGSLFAFYAATCALTVVFVASCVPETRGRTLEDIEAELRLGWSR